MRTRFLGCRGGPYTLVVGVWDPLLTVHKKLFQQVCERASNNGSQVLAVTLDPAPTGQLRGQKVWPPFSSVLQRVLVQRCCGIKAQALVNLTRDELDLGVGFFLDNLREAVDIREVVLGAGQSLGSTGRGDFKSVESYCKRNNINLTCIPHSSHLPGVCDARQSIREGSLHPATRMIGHPLFWDRPRSRHLRLPWPEGTYKAIVVESPLVTCFKDSPITLNLDNCGELSQMLWPSRAIKWLGFVSGPADES